MTATTRTFLTLGPAGLSLEWSDEDALEPDHLASSPAPQAADESTGAWIIHHPSRGGPSSGLREVMMASEIYGRRAAPVLGLSWDVMPSLANAGNLVRSKHKRPGQWTDRTRAKRAKRLWRADARRERKRVRREQGRHR